MTENKQPIKSITKQDIDDLKNYLEQLASWTEPLKLVNDFFENQAIPLNKKKIMREFHAQAKVFNIFYLNFLLSMDTLEEKASNLEANKKRKM
ncbi:TPA: hypothetical protein ACSKM7_000010 [Listeria innocua]|uniref:hypothetical protein n=1 Tax=Listeria innocua TaxID=1642 RepID=UPI001C8BADEA|nr:hypothetical protein [Listeria innocua]EJQ0569386.1 hypothetical protein [Listeria innocua]EKF1877054.1 hypothetical protein [Listeria innocua]EKK3338732.1 hypothetical protein [Listeria innocua]EKY3961808.1 hypothetical protein [Listeria innocua]EKY3970714.1 hypothetical protein [Listeria innocua]